MDLILFLKEYWTIVIALVGLIISYARMESAIRSLKATDEKQEKQIEKNLDLHNKDVVYLQAKLEANSLEFKKIEIALEGLKVNVEFIKQQLNKK
jgi:hypothetical protein